MAFCSKCGISIAAETAFCGACGNSVAVEKNQNITDKISVAKFNKLVMAVYIVGAILTVIGYGNVFGILSMLLLPYILFKLSGSLGMEKNNTIIFAVLGVIPLINFVAAVFLNVKAAKLLKSV
jgi:hypothetical protein